MEIINVIVTRDGIVNEIESFGVSELSTKV
jgi:hypothetical protein